MDSVPCGVCDAKLVPLGRAKPHNLSPFNLPRNPRHEINTKRDSNAGDAYKIYVNASANHFRDRDITAGVNYGVRRRRYGEHKA